MGTGVAEAAILGAALGGGSSALLGGDPLKGALFGGLTGGIGSGIGGALAGGGASAVPVGASEGLASLVQTPSVFGAAGNAAQAFPLTEAAFTPLTATTAPAAQFAPAAQAAKASLYTDPFGYLAANKGLAAGSGFAGLMASGALDMTRKTMGLPEPYKGPLSKFRFNPDTYQAADYSMYGMPRYAAGGITNATAVKTVPSMAEQQVAQNFAAGGISQLGSYSDGGRMLKGPGDGMSDSIPASIAGKRPARLADGEFVVPADVVSHIGNGSTDAGAKQLYAMMDRVRRARTGKTQQGRQIKPQKLLPV